MLHPAVIAGSTDQSVWVRFIDSTDGTPETGVAYNSSGIDLWYQRDREAKTSITEVTLASVSAAHADGGFIHVGDGLCRLDLPDAAFATVGNGKLLIGGTVTGMILQPAIVPIVAAPVLKKNTPLNEYTFCMFDETTEELLPGLTVTVQRSLDGGTLSAGTISGITDLGGGRYSCDFAAADRNGNTVYVQFSATGAKTHGFTWLMES